MSMEKYVCIAMNNAFFLCVFSNYYFENDLKIKI